MGAGISVNEKYIKRPHIGDTVMHYGSVFHAVGYACFGTLQLVPETPVSGKDLGRNHISVKSGDAAFDPKQITRGKRGIPLYGGMPESKREDTMNHFHDGRRMGGDELE